jgi:hypothetical protein
MKKIKKVIKKEKWTFGISLILFLSLNIILNKTYLTLPNLFSTYKLSFVIPFFLINIVATPLLVATTIAMTTNRIKLLEKISKKKSTFGAIGTFFGILGGACPGCFIGIFPATLGIFGITANLSSLPLAGFELGLASIFFLTISLFYLSKDMTCQVNSR